MPSQKRIYEWSTGLPVWQRDLLRRVAAGPLSAEDERDILRIVAGSADAPAPEPLKLRHLPADEEEHGPVLLRSIRDLRNINCLANGQTLALEPGLNVVFGLNGAGKSGYGRLLRRVSRSGDPDEILRDVFDPGSGAGRQTAELAITVNGNAREVHVDLDQEPDRVLSAMSAFDASRARVYLSKPNVIEHVPRPLRMLRALTETQDGLAAVLRDRVRERREKPSGLPALDPATAAGSSLADLSADSDSALIVELAKFTRADRERLDELEVAAASIKVDQRRRLERAARTQARAGRDAAAALTEAASKLSPEELREVAALHARLKEITAAEQALAAGAFADQRFDATGQGPWREMWFAAERFAQAAGGQFPSYDPDAACPLCQQDLEEAARVRLLRFEEFVTSDLRQQAVDLSGELAATLRDLPDLATVRATIEGTLRGAPDEVTSAAGAALDALDGRDAKIRNAAQGKANCADPVPIVDVASLTAYAETQLVAAEYQVGLRDEEAQQRVMTELGGLRARGALVAAEQSILEHVENLKAIARMEDAIRRLNTKKISDQLGELQEAVITERLRNAIEQELAELDPIASRVEVVGRVSKAETVIQLRFKEPCRAKVGNVLSDGEQRALALAFFLAEVAVSDGRSAIMLDDPVSSLDHERRTYLAERLAEESRRRQVIVYTHDMTFVHLLQEAADEADVPLHGQTLERAYGRAGVVADELPTKMLGTGRRLKALRHRLRFELTPMHERQDPDYEREADRWVADLRKAYDQLVEDGVLGSVVRRFSPFVRMKNLDEVKCTPEIVARVRKGQKKTSPKTHHEALELQPVPRSPAKLEALLDEFTGLVEDLQADKDGEGRDTPMALAPPEEAGETPVIRAVQQQSS